MSNGDDMGGGRGGMEKTDEEMEMDRREARRRDEESSYRDVSNPILLLSVLILILFIRTLSLTPHKRERRYEPRERQRITTLERSMARERQQREAEERDRVEMRKRLDEWDDDASDEMFYVDRWVHYSFFFLSCPLFTVSV
jgi:RNA-binding protein 25